MGHERVGILPHTKPWNRIVAQLSGFSEEETSVTEIANTTLQNVRRRFQQIHTDNGVKAAFTFLVALSATDCSTFTARAPLVPQIDLSENPSPLRIATLLHAWVDSHRQSLEYADIAKKSAADAIAYWISREKQQPSLFDKANNARGIWSMAGTGAGFCEISRVFFAKFTERYLNYFLCRSASGMLPDIDSRSTFGELLENHVETVSKYAFETSKITQSFAAGWFNNHVLKNKLSGRQVEVFLKTAFGKLQDELLREVSHK